MVFLFLLFRVMVFRWRILSRVFCSIEQLAERFYISVPKVENTALLIGDNERTLGTLCKEVKRLLAYFSIKVIGQFPDMFL